MTLKAIGLFLGLILCVACQPPGSDQTTPSVELEEIARFGGVSGSGDLTWVTAVSVSRGEVFVLDPRSVRVVVFAEDGTWLRDIGRAGAGPGEFSRPEGIGMSGDLLWVGDPSGQRLEMFTRQGSARQSIRWTIPGDSLGTLAGPLAPLADGSVLAAPQSLPIGGVVRGAVTHRDYYRVPESGETPRLLYRERIVRSDFMLGEAPSGGFMVGAHPHRQSPLVAPFPDGSGLLVVEREAAASGERTTFQLKTIRPDGMLLVDRSVSYDPISAEGWLDRHVAELEQQMLSRSGSIDRGFIQEVRRGLADLPYYPPVTAVVAGADGVVWLRREDVPLALVRWDIHDPDGAFVGSAQLPNDMRIVSASRGEAWGVKHDEYDVPVLYRFRLIQPGTT